MRAYSPTDNPEDHIAQDEWCVDLLTSIRTYEYGELTIYGVGDGLIWDECTKHPQSAGITWESQQVNRFTQYLLDYYGPDGLYDFGLTREDAIRATNIYKGALKTGVNFEGDSVDREAVRDILLDDTTDEGGFAYTWKDTLLQSRHLKP